MAEHYEQKENTQTIQEQNPGTQTANDRAVGEKTKKSLRIETLFPEIANLYGDHANIRYLKLCVPDAEYVEDALSEVPHFVTQKPDMIYMGPMTERQQELVIAKLRPYVDRIQELIDEGVVFLITGNAMEVFWDTIENEDGTKIEGLSLFHYTAKRKMYERYNCAVMGMLDDIRLVGFKNQFTQSYGDNSGEYLYRVTKGDGINRETKYEGVRRNNFMGTYTTGPLLLLNPDFALYIQKLLGVENPKLVYEEAARDAYEERVKQYEQAEFVPM